MAASKITYANVVSKGTPNVLPPVNAQNQNRSSGKVGTTPSKNIPNNYDAHFPEMSGGTSVAKTHTLTQQKTDVVVNTPPVSVEITKKTQIVEQNIQQQAATNIVEKSADVILNTEKEEANQTIQKNVEVQQQEPNTLEKQPQQLVNQNTESQPTKETDRSHQKQHNQFRNQNNYHSRQQHHHHQQQQGERQKNTYRQSSSHDNQKTDDLKDNQASNDFVEVNNKERNRKKSLNQEHNYDSDRPRRFDRNNNDSKRQNDQHDGNDNRGKNMRRQQSDDPNFKPKFDFAAKKAEEENQLNERFKNPKDKFCFEEVKGDLFSVGANVSLAHCVSVDLEMGKGIATVFKREFGRVDELKSHYPKVGKCLFLNDKQRHIFYLITKPRYFHKPTYKSLEDSLLNMKSHCEKFNVTELAMPKIGCGLDLLEWNYVSKIIDDVFANSNTKIKIYELDKQF